MKRRWEDYVSTRLLVQANNIRDIVLSKEVEVEFWRVDWVTIVVSVLMVRAGKGQKLVRDNPIQVSIFYTLRDY